VTLWYGFAIAGYLRQRTTEGAPVEVAMTVYKNMIDYVLGIVPVLDRQYEEAVKTERQ
jgi:hypothetical protein